MRRLLAIVTLLALLGPAPGQAQESRAFVVRLGSDTLTIERYTRTKTQLKGEYLGRAPRASHREYTADLNADGTVRRFEILTHNLSPGVGPMETKVTIEFAGDSARVTTPRGDSTVTTRVAAGKNAAPIVNGVMGVLEQIGRQARAAGATSGKTVTLPLVATGTGPGLKGIVVAGGGDTLTLTIETPTGKAGPYAYGLDKTGAVTWFDGEGSTFQAVGARVPSVDIAAQRAAYASHPLGALSACDTTRAKLGDAELWVDYGRPSKRGREIFGNVVAWNAVWRTGANAATQFHTSVDLIIGETEVPAGTYTLWTLPSAEGWKLIINKQTGQWGTDYHAEQDLARVDLVVETLPDPLEQFTITIEPGEPGAQLRLSWDRTRASVSIRKKE